MGKKNEETSLYEIYYRCDLSIAVEGVKDVKITPFSYDNIQTSVDYGKDFTPIHVVTIKLSSEDLFKLKKYEDKLLVYFKKTLVKYQHGGGKGATTKEVETKLLFDNVYIPIIEQADVTQDDKLINPEKVKENDSKGLTKENDVGIHVVKLYLMSVKYHIMYKRVFNAVLRGTGDGITIGSAVRFIAESSSCDKYILDLPDNRIHLENIVIPSGNVKYCLEALQLLYGIYLYDLLTFYDDFSVLYILNRLSTSHDYLDKQTKHVTLVHDWNLATKVEGAVGYGENGNITHHVAGLDDKSVKISSGEAKGNSVIYSNYGIGSDSVGTDPKGKLISPNDAAREYVKNITTHVKTPKGFSFVYDELNNSFATFSKMSVDSLDAFFVVTASGMDISCLNPNVMYSVQVFSDAVKDNSTNANANYKDKLFNLSSYTQTLIKVDKTPNSIEYRSHETLVLLDTSSMNKAK